MSAKAIEAVDPHRLQRVKPTKSFAHRGMVDPCFMPNQRRTEPTVVTPNTQLEYAARLIVHWRAEAPSLAWFQLVTQCQAPASEAALM